MADSAREKRSGNGIAVTLPALGLQREYIFDDTETMEMDAYNLGIILQLSPRPPPGGNNEGRSRMSCQTLHRSLTARKDEDDMKVYPNFCKVAEDRDSSKQSNIMSILQLSPRLPGGSNKGKSRHDIDEVFALMNKSKRDKKEKRERLYNLVISRIKAAAAHPPVDNRRNPLTSGKTEEENVPSDSVIEEPQTYTNEFHNLAALNSLNLKNEIEEVQRKLLVSIVGLTFCVSARNALFCKQMMIEKALKRICAIVSAYRYKKKLRAMTTILWPIKFIVAMKIAKKNFATTVIKYFVDFSMKKKFSMPFVVRKFYVRIKLMQRLIRSYLQIRRCRKDMILIYWDKIEKRCRHVFEEREKRRLEAQRILITKRLANQKGHNNIHVKWHKIHSKVQMLQQHINIVTFDCMQTVQSDKKNITDDIVSNNKTTRSEFKSYFSYNHRMEIILKHMTSKCRIHRARIEIKKQEISTASTVDVKHAMLLLANPTKLSGENKDIILEAQLATSIDAERISIEIKDLSNTPILYLTGSLGPSWKHIIEEVVREQIEAISSTS